MAVLDVGVNVLVLNIQAVAVVAGIWSSEFKISVEDWKVPVEDVRLMQ